jgi:eukaryotic-like serine/threonine-protein kinase
VRALFVAVGIDSTGFSVAKSSTALPDLPDLDAFAKPAVVVDLSDTAKAPRPLTLADVAAELTDPARVFTEAVELDSVDDSASDEIDPKLAADAVATVRTPQPNIGARRGKTPGKAGALARTFAIGAVVAGRYDVRSQLGRGGHATVLRVFDRELEEECALKVFHNSGDAEDVARFKREVSISRRIVHENVVKLYDIGVDDGLYYLTMELLEGADLGNVLKKQSTTLGEALRWLVDACAGLQAAHDKGVVHRDVKPGNLFVLREGIVKVTDFGIAKPADALSLTSTGMFVGTPQYVSPEQVQGKDITPAADIYSLGVVAYLVLTGSLPFRDKEMLALLMKHATATPDRARVRNPSLPPVLDDLLASCLAKDPRDRPSSCAEVATTMESVLRGR